MKSRCYRPSNVGYANYGGRGVQVCAAWRDSFETFDLDMRSGYKPGLHIDRIDVDGDYTPVNCRWVTPSESNRNKRPYGAVPYSGVYRAPDGYRASIYLGCYPTPEEANEARQKALERVSDLL